VDVTDVTLDDRGRLTLPKDVRERYGERYHLVRLGDGIKLVPIAEDPLAALREEFRGVEGTAGELREAAREEALDEAGR
jgi:bifunctional DNA-binding transcriptional regulator/antitoxin component of YhaV-PrlF toxin-antitoxin module